MSNFSALGAFDPLCDFRDYARIGPIRLLARFLHGQKTPIPQAGAPPGPSPERRARVWRTMWRLAPIR